jgi:hypothetical protein
MKLNEIIETDGISKVSDKTNISVENLEYLVKKDFKSLNRVKALGFITILKREYSADVDELEESVKEYFENNPEDDGKPILVSANHEKSGYGIVKWFIILGLLYGVWNLYSSGKLDGVLSNSGIKQEHILADDEVLKSDVTEASAEKVVVSADEESRAEVKIESVKIPNKEQKAETTPKVEAVTTELVTEKNSTLKDEKSDAEKNEKEIEKESNEEKNEKEIDIEKEVDEVVKENSNINNQNQQNSAEETISEETTTADNEEAEIIYTVTVNPRVNLWFGFINVDTKERKEFMTDESRSVDVAAHRWILVTGHGRVSVASEHNTLKINDRVKHFFYIDSSQMKEISRSEFRALNDGKGW